MTFFALLVERSRLGRIEVRERETKKIEGDKERKKNGFVNVLGAGGDKKKEDSNGPSC